jgi:trimethylamine--corrinoid protein Co-methyltransferase
MAAAAELAHGYGLPLVGIGALSDSKVPDGQAAAEMACNILAAMLAGVDLVYDAGVLECGLTYSPEAVVLVDEVAGMCKRFLQGLAVDEESLALDVVRAVGIGGQFLGHGHTLEHFRSELWNPVLMNRQSRERWQQAGGTGTRDRARARVAEILETHIVEPLPDDVTAAMAEIIDTRRKSLALSGAAH